MNAFKDRRVVIALAVAAGLLLLVALALANGAGRPRRAAPEGPRAALKVRMGETGGGKLDPKAPLRCFVNGRFAGETSLTECARRNGVSTGKMDVGVDASGQVAAAGEGEAGLEPLPEARPPSGEDVTPATAIAAPPPQPIGARCLRYSRGEWRDTGVGLSLTACVRVLYEGRCVRPGDALYGRYGERTLRLVPGRVEASNNDRDFSALVGQDPESCTLDG